jgi:imidazolonepropionase
MLITHIDLLANVRYSQNRLRGEELAHMPLIRNAYLRIENGRIADFGPMQNLRNEQGDLNASGRILLPTWCDSHTHTVFAATREEEFIAKLKGLSYAEIAAKGGGILNSAKKLASTSEDELFETASQRIKQMIALGTGALEIKSGYGLSTEAELKMLRVIRRLKAWAPIPIKATFLGAHALPLHADKETYLREVLEEMLPQIAVENLADYIDVFCETGFFSEEDSLRILTEGKKYGLKGKIHANQLNLSGGVQAGYAGRALSVDHLETVSQEEIQLLGRADAPMATLLPTAAYFLRINFPPARALLDAGASVVLASDYNPGSSPSGNMNTVFSMACIQMRMLPEEAINAATLNGAYAMEVEEEVGSITVGKRANFILTKPVPSLAYLPYSFGENWIEHVYINGKRSDDLF